LQIFQQPVHCVSQLQGRMENREKRKVGSGRKEGVRKKARSRVKILRCSVKNLGCK